MIKAIIFDVDGVLIDSFEANLKFFQRLMDKAGYTPPTREKYQNVFAMNMMEAIETLTQSDSEQEIKRIWQMGKNREVIYDSELVAMPEGAAEVIKTLGRDFILGIVTSRIKESVYEAPALAELASHFKVAVGYQDTTNHKPHPEPLLFAAKKLGVKPKECIYIGDALSDLQAGRAAGMQVIIYSENKEDGANAWTASFPELSTLVTSIANISFENNSGQVSFN